MADAGKAFQNAVDDRARRATTAVREKSDPARVTLANHPRSLRIASAVTVGRVRYQFVDCRWDLGDPEAGRRLYLGGHIPGASFLDVDTDLSSPPGARGRHPLPDAEQFARAVGRAGVGDGVFVATYGSMGGAERLWWLLRHFGHDACAVIDLESWRGPLTSGEETIERAAFNARPRDDDTIEADELAGTLAELIVVDARVPSRWRGEPNAIDRNPGRIPGAINSPWNEPPADLPEGELVAYCGSGVTACVVLHRLQLRGREGKLYPGGWSEWEQRDELPRELG
jgi:thiosulfate/3-mercaptopyruvate sulfurtransferase